MVWCIARLYHRLLLPKAGCEWGLWSLLRIISAHATLLPISAADIGTAEIRTTSRRPSRGFSAVMLSCSCAARAKQLYRVSLWFSWSSSWPWLSSRCFSFILPRFSTHLALSITPLPDHNIASTLSWVNPIVGDVWAVSYEIPGCLRSLICSTQACSVRSRRVSTWSGVCSLIHSRCPSRWPKSG